MIEFKKTSHCADMALNYRVVKIIGLDESLHQIAYDLSWDCSLHDFIPFDTYEIY